MTAKVLRMMNGSAQAGEKPCRPTWLATRLLSSLLGVLILGQALGYLFLGEMMVGMLGHHYDPHMAKEQGFAYLSVAAGNFLVAIWPHESRSALAPSILLSIVLGLFGAVELLTGSHNLAGDLGHVAQALLGGALLVAWIRKG